MRCPFCNADKDKVIDSRSAEGGTVIRRRRECLACQRRFTTYERIEDTVKLIVVKKDGTRVPYDRAKLLRGLQNALYKRPIPVDRLTVLVESVEDELYRTFEKEVESQIIGEIASKHLKDVDQVAYVRFASVYKEFRDLDDLLHEVREMVELRQHLDPPDQAKLFELE